MTEMVPSGLMRGRWRRSDGPLEGDTRPKWGETAGPRTPWTPPRQCPTPLLVHCRTREEAERVRQAVQERLARCKLELRPSKTKIVYCKDSHRRASYPEDSFEFLSFTFRPRRARNRRGEYFVSFSPAISPRAAKRIRQEMRRSWCLPRRTDKDLTDLAHMFNPVIRGWIGDRKSTRLNSSHSQISYAVFCLKKKKKEK